MSGVRLPMGLVLDSALVAGSDVTFETDPFAVVLGEDASAVVQVSCASLASYLSSLDLGGLRDVSVTTEDRQLVIGATAVVLIPIRATIVCSLAVRDGKMLDIVLESAEPGPAYSMVERKLAEINPVLDLTGLFMDIEITSVEIDGEWVTLNGTAR